MKFTKEDIKLQKAYLLTRLIREYYVYNSTGGVLHIVLDDCNYDRSSIEWCLEEAKKNNDYFGITIAELLLEFPIDYIKEIIEEPFKILQYFITLIEDSDQSKETT